MIEVKGLSKSFGSRQVLKGITLSLEKGKVYGIVGENGAGKTTLFKCLVGLEKYEGEIVSEISPLRERSGFLHTQSHFLSHMTGREYIRLLLNAREVAVSDIDQFNLFDLPLEQYASTYSTGMKKKLALTAILYQGNDFFILDEPFNGVDIQSNVLISALIARLKELKKTVLMSSHIFSTLSESCDEIFVLKEGRIQSVLGRDAFDDFATEMEQIDGAGKISGLQFP